MNDNAWLVERFEARRAHLRGVAYRMLGSLSDADDAVQDAWIRVSRAGADDVQNFDGWLTTIVARVCLNMLQSRKSRHEEPLDAHVPDPVVGRADGPDPEHEALLADSVGLALLVVLDALPPPERVAFVLHDVFAVPFDEIAPIVGRSPAAARQLASRARRRVQGSAATPDPDLARQREVVDAFLAAARNGDFEGLLTVLDPDVLLRVDGGARSPGTRVVRGAATVAGQALLFGRGRFDVQPALVNGAAGALTRTKDGRPFAVMAATVSGGRIVEIDILSDTERVRALDLSALGG